MLFQKVNKIEKTKREISMCNQMVTSEIIPLFHEYTIWLPINIIGDELR